MKDKNLPDNIRDFDHHPGSPFYVEPDLECITCKKHFRPEDFFTLLPGEDNKRPFCTEICLDKYIKENALEVYVEMFEKIEELSDL